MTARRGKTDTYISIRCVIPADQEEELPELLESWSVLGTEVHEGSDGGVGVTVYLSGTDLSDAEAVRQKLIEIGAQNAEQKIFEAADWLEGYREQSQPFTVGSRWWIDPHPDQPTAAPSGRRRLAIEPRMAFGSGSHESTQAILMALEDIALAAESMGASSVVGLDIDEAAVRVARETAQQQEWPSRVNFVLGPVDCIGGEEFDIVMCNMITSSFLPLAGEFRSRLAPAGLAVFSGLLASEIELVSGALMEAGFAIPSYRVLGDWASLIAVVATVP